eukprot:CAMPEP_0170995408 /NCGR_PEP_ID=MMETSP0736-20130129/11577_1 /TAXON_ID=186038 /ORGANISM="Fragilariopsis kerguelensis, Strain L26-C5" /LENGTH=685 /DNA_ID=CAMNT_0011421563 /DNA_START=279 /DNA_END=2335 /DNA_ORIENTATION=-
MIEKERRMKLLLLFLSVATTAVTGKPRVVDEEPGTVCPEWYELKPCVAAPQFKNVPEQYQNLIALDKSTMYAPLTPLPDFPQGSKINLHLDLIYYIGPSWSGPLTAWNGMSPPPTIHVQPGETLTVSLKNQLHEPFGNDIHNSYRLPNNTNFHTHGLHISGEGTSDNVLVDIPPGGNFTYTHDIAENHMPGTHWMHPHFHGSTALQTGSGVCGMFVVDDPYGYLPTQIALLPEIRMMILQLDLEYLEGAAYTVKSMTGGAEGSAGVLYWGDQGQHIQRTNAVTANPDLFLINMQYIPRITVERGKWYRMRTVLASINEGIIFRPPEGCDLQLLAKDGIYLDDAPRRVDAFYLRPGNRADVAMRCDVEEGAYSIDIVSTGMFGPDNTEASQYYCENKDGIKDRFLQAPDECNPQPRLAVLHVIDRGGDNMEPDLEPFGAGLSRPCYVADTRAAPKLGAEPFELAFGSAETEVIPEGNPGAGGTYGTLGVNAQAWDMNRKSAAFPMGTVNQIEYSTVGTHPYHHHVIPFQLANIDGRIGVVNGLNPDNWYQDGDWGDTIQYVVTKQQDGTTNTQATLRFATDSYPGICIFHCHILIHEDRGMMGFYNFTGGPKVWEGAKLVNPQCRMPASALLPYEETETAIPLIPETEEPTLDPTTAPVRRPTPPSVPLPDDKIVEESTQKKKKKY